MSQRNYRTVALSIGVTAFALIAAGCTATPESSEGPVTLTWTFWDAAQPQALVDAFEADNPDITIEFTQPAYNDYLNALRPSLTSNSGPDVFQLAPGTLIENYAELAEPLDSYAEDAFGDDWKSQFAAGSLEALALDGSQVALPNYLSGAGLIYYSSDILTEVGVSVPTNLDEWVTTCETIRAAGYDCLAHGAKDAWVNTDVFLSLANSVAPGKIYDAISGDVEWTDPDLVEAMTAWRSLFTTGIIQEGSTGLTEYPDAFSAWLGGKSAFIALGTWNTPGSQTNAGIAVSQESVTETIDSVFLSAPFPAANSASEPTKPFGGVANGWSINSSSEHKEAAAKFVAFLSGEKGQQILGTLGVFPALKSAKVDTSDVFDQRQVADIERQQASLGDLSGYREIPNPDLAAAIGQALSEVAAGTADPKTAMSTLQAAAAAL